MSKNFTKKFLCLFTFCVIALSLFACSSNKGTAYGDLKNDVTYFKQGDYTLSEKALYDKMLSHKTGTTFTFMSTLKKMVNQKVLSSYLEEVDQNWETEYKEEAEKLVKKEVYGTDEDEKIAKMSSSTKKVQERKFLDSQISKGIVTSNVLDAKILENYKYQFATERFSKKVLELDVTREFLKDENGEETDDKNPNFIDDESIQNYYDTNYKGKNDFSVIVLKFTNLNEAEQYLKDYTTSYNSINYKGLKSYKDELYLVPVNKNYDTILNESNIAEYQKFSDLNGGKDLILMYVSMYMDLFKYSSDITQSDFDSLRTKTFDQIVTELSTNEKYKVFQKDYEDFSKSNSAVSNYVATKLKVEQKENEDKMPRYTSTPKSISSSFYYIYKLTDGTDKELNDELKAEIRGKIIDEKNSSSYVSEKIAALEKELTLTLFDGNIQNMFKVLSEDFKTNGKKSDTLLCQIKVKANDDLFLAEKTYDLTVREFYTELEKQIGLTVAIESAYMYEVSKLTSYDAKFTSDEVKAFKTDSKKVISDFKAGTYASYGLPAAVGQKTFLQIYFGLSNKNQLIDNFYKPQKRSELFLKDLALNLKQDNSDYYETIANYSKNYHDKYFKTTVGHILVYTDLDLDGTPDNPESYTAEEKLKFDQIAEELQSYFYTEAKKLSGKINSSLKWLADQFNKANKFDKTCYSKAGETCIDGKTFGNLKQQGVYVKYESLGEVSLSNYSSYDSKFIEKLNEVLDRALTENDDIVEEQEYFYEVKSLSDLAVTSFGYHLIVISNIDDMEDITAKYTKENDYGNSFGNIKYDDNEKEIDAYSDNEYLSRNQVEIFMREKDLSGGIKNLPTKVKDACEEFVRPIITKYNTAENQFFLKLTLLKNIDFTDDSRDSLLKLYKDSLINVFFGYSLLDKHDTSPLSTWFQDNYNYTIGGAN